MENKSFTQSVDSLAKAENKKEVDPIGHQVSELAHARNAEKKQDEMIVSDESVNVGLGNESQTLVLQTALEGINAVLQDTLGDHAIQTAYESNIDVSPETTAERIISSSVQAFPAFQEQHPEFTQEEAVAAFVDIIREGIASGFTEAKDVLIHLNALQDDYNENNIDQTFALMQEKLLVFVDSFNHPEANQA